MAGLFRPHYSFLQTNAWQRQAANALKYNTSQVGSVVPMVYGKVRQQMNLLALAGYSGPGGGKKGKGVGSLPIGGTSTTAKGGGGGKKGGKKGPPDFKVYVDFAVCEGPADIPGDNLVFESAQVASFGQLPLNFYNGDNGQHIDETMASRGLNVNYSGTCHVTATPIDLGTTPTLPNLSFEVNGFCWNTLGSAGDADPGQVIAHFLTDPQRGALFPPENLGDLSDFSAYCQAAGLGVSVSLEGQQSALDWLDGFLRVLSATMVWSGSLLKIIPWADTMISDVLPNINWSPNLESQYDLNDDDFLPWSPVGFGEPKMGDDPILMTRVNPTDVANWVSMEYKDRFNAYNSTVISAFDQSSIDAYGLRIGDNYQGMQFASVTPAQFALRSIVQRTQYIRNTPYKFKLGWRYALLEPMDIVTLTGGTATGPGNADSYLYQQPVRILSIEEDDNGDLTIEAEEIPSGTGPPHPTQQPNPWLTYPPAYFPEPGSCGPTWGMGRDYSTYDPTIPNLDEDNPKGTMSVWIMPDMANMADAIYTFEPSFVWPYWETVPERPTLKYASIFATSQGGAVEWTGQYIQDNELVTWPTFIPKPHIGAPLPPRTVYSANDSIHPALSIGYTDGGQIIVIASEFMTPDSYAEVGLHIQDVGYDPFNPDFNPWMLVASAYMVSDVGVIKNDAWQNVYFCWDAGEGIYDVYVNGSKIGLGIIDKKSYGFFKYLEPGGYQEFKRTPGNISWHVVDVFGPRVLPTLIYYAGGHVGCITDFWFKKGINMGFNGISYFYDWGSGTARWNGFGPHGELYSGAEPPDMWVRNLRGNSAQDFQIGVGINHAARLGDGQGFPGYIAPIPCTSGPGGVGTIGPPDYSLPPFLPLGS